MEEEVMCNNCQWVGDTTMLVSETDAVDDPCNKCPDCGSDEVEDFE